MDLLKRKTIRIPISGDVDVTNVINLIDHPVFQRLHNVSQLGPVAVVYPGGTHTRFVHSLGTYHRMGRLSDRWIKEGLRITRKGYRRKDILRALEVYALLHDIGHPPLSHVTEYILSESHDEYGAKLVDLFRDYIRAIGVSFELVKAFFLKQDPFYQVVVDKNAGVDKGDYLLRDSRTTAYGGMPEVERVFSYVYWRDGKLVLDYKAASEAMHLQRAYVLMYKQVYLRKSSLIVQRVYQKAVGNLLDNGFPEDVIWEMDDIDLVAELRNSQEHVLKRVQRPYLPKLFASFRPFGKEWGDRVAGKGIRVLGVDEDVLTKLVKTPTRDLIDLERDIAKILNISVNDILIVPSQGGYRFVPQDIDLVDGKNVFSMKKVFPEHFASLAEEGRNHLAFWVCAFGDRRRFAKQTEEIRDYLLSL